MRRFQMSCPDMGWSIMVWLSTGSGRFRGGRWGQSMMCRSVDGFSCQEIEVFCDVKRLPKKHIGSNWSQIHAENHGKSIDSRDDERSCGKPATSTISNVYWDVACHRLRCRDVFQIQCLRLRAGDVGVSGNGRGDKKVQPPTGPGLDDAFGMSGWLLDRDWLVLLWAQHTHKHTHILIKWKYSYYIYNIPVAHISSVDCTSIVNFTIAQL